MTEIQDVAVRLGETLAEREMTISVGEIDTGGLIGSRLMAVPGATRFFKGGIIKLLKIRKQPMLLKYMRSVKLRPCNQK